MLAAPLPALPLALPGLELASPFCAMQMSAAVPWECFDPILARLAAHRDAARLARCQQRHQSKRDGHRAVPLIAVAAPTSRGAQPAATGRKPWPLRSLLAAFLLRPTQRVEDKVSDVHMLLSQNPVFAAACGFRFPAVPGYRTLARFDREMRHLGFWGEVRLAAVRANFDAGVIVPEALASVDTTHIEAEAVLGHTCPGPDGSPVPTDEHAAVLAKSAHRTFIAHKAVMIALPHCAAPLTALDLRGSTSDAHTLRPIAEKFRAEFPDLTAQIREIAADGIYQTADNRAAVPEVLGPQAQLRAPIHPGRTQPKPLARPGMRELSPHGIPVCQAGHTLRLQGRDLQRGEYLWHCPLFGVAHPDPTRTCAPELHQACCAGSAQGRTLRTPQALSPHIDWECPQPSARFRRSYRQRARIEGSFGILSEVFLIRRLHQRGAEAGQAHLDRTLASMHLWLYARHVLARHQLVLAA